MSDPDHTPEPDVEITFSEARVLGSLLEKEATTPDYYPMTLNSLQAACNQKSNREPITELDESTIERALESLRSKRLCVKVHMAGSRVPKYKHTLDNVLNLDQGQTALLCVLLLRGIQTAGELNQRTERIHNFGSVEAVEAALETMMEYATSPLVTKLPAGSGRRVATYAHLLSGEPDLSAAPASGGSVSAQQIVLEEEASWRQKLEGEIASLKGQLAELQEEFQAFKEQFDS